MKGCPYCIGQGVVERKSFYVLLSYENVIGLVRIRL
jgi:hypothetical protein